MLTKLTIRNFKRFADVEIDIGNPVVFIGPNDSGKTTALRALVLWDVGLKRWLEKRGGEPTPKSRPGVAINRRDLVGLPVPTANLLWRNLRLRNAEIVGGSQQTANVRIDVVVEGVTDSKPWRCGLEFDYANEESFYCCPLRLDDTKNPQRMHIPGEAAAVNVALLPPMSGLAANETRLVPGRLNVLMGEGRTAEVLRNLCYDIFTTERDGEPWGDLQERMRALFGVELDPPLFVKERGEVVMTYRDRAGVRLDLSCSGRGLQQTLLLLAYFYTHQNSVLLLDEPDAHLEIFRQRQVYQLLAEVSAARDCQVVAASHSEVLLNEAADRDVVVAFVGRPHRIDNRGGEVLKALKEIGFEHYYQAEQRGWVLYLEGSTDLAILREFARKLDHPVAQRLERAFVHYVGNQLDQAGRHFNGIREAKPDLVGFALYDRLEKEVKPQPGLAEHCWSRYEIENYLCQPETLLAFAAGMGHEQSGGPLFAGTEGERYQKIMRSCIDDVTPPVALRDRADSWWVDTKASAYLGRVFDAFYKELNLPSVLRKTDYYVLARLVPEELMDREIAGVLDVIEKTARSARPLAEEI